ncbi:MAG TPA: tetratricopeptide repeat protein [Steroidobacteraceae bacterium]|nr:tetratricopeptide repeat protein [Steroidobacteraceae bacterium]
MNRFNELMGTRRRASAAVLTLIVWMGFAANTKAAPYKPESPDTLLLELDASQQQASAKRRAANLQNNKAGAIELAREFVALGRAHHDERYFGYASAALQRWQQDAQAPLEVVLLRADIAQHQHRFNEARIILDGLLVRDPNQLTARLMRAALHMTQGEPHAALQDCQKLFSLREPFAATICLAHAHSSSGKLDESYRLVSTMLQQIPPGRRDTQVAWAWGVAADMAQRSGKEEEAEQWLRKALTQDSNDLVSRLELCDLFLHTQRPNEALKLLAALPASEPILLRRALGAKQLSAKKVGAMEVGAKPDLALAEWRAAVERSERLGITLHLRELARGQLELLNDPTLALHTALKNWEVQREPVDVRLLVAAARAAGNAAALQRVREWQNALRFEDRSFAL